MSYSRESNLFVDSDTSLNVAPLANQEPITDEEDLKLIDETITAVSRNMRRGDWAYLCQHPEVRAIIRVIVTEAVKERPKNIFNFAAELFSSKNHKELEKKINKQMRWLSCQLKPGAWAPAEGVVPFTESTSEDSFMANKVDCREGGQRNGPEKSSECGDFVLRPGACPENFKPSC